jgi:hypothetical protein
VQRWLRSTQVGTCSTPASSREGRANACNATTTGAQGEFLLPGHVTTWPLMAEHCITRCLQCAMCQYVSLSAGMERCRWYATCPALDQTDTLALLPERPSQYRTGLVRRGADGGVRRTERAVSARSWLATAHVGTCGREGWSRMGDCETGESGAFRILPRVDLRGVRSLTRSCIHQCARCSRCASLSVSYQYRTCAWYASPCQLPPTRVWKRGHAFLGRYPGGLNGSLYVTARASSAASASAPLASRPSSFDHLPARTGEPATAITSNPKRRLLLVTTTYASRAQLGMLTYLAGLLSGLRNFVWIVVEDAAEPSVAVGALLNASGLPHAYMATGPTRQKGHEQRNAAYEYIRRRQLAGVVYNMDDDNSYAPALWEELRSVRPGRVGVMAVRLNADGFLERPMYDKGGQFIGWDAGWCYSGWSATRLGPRFFCIDMGGFAFSSELLWQVAPADYGGGTVAPLAAKPWAYDGIVKYQPNKMHRKGHRRARVIEWRGGESQFVERLLPQGFPEDLQPLGNCGHDTLVYHNGYLTKTSKKESERNAHARWERSVHAGIRVSCKLDGW